jgi:hypothetical protein
VNFCKIHWNNCPGRSSHSGYFGIGTPIFPPKVDVWSLSMVCYSFYLVRSHSTRNPTLEQSMLKYKIQNLDHFFHKIVLTRSAAASVAAGSNLLISNQYSLTFVQGSSLQKHSAWESLISNLLCICFHISSQTTKEPGGHLMKFLSLSVL